MSKILEWGGHAEKLLRVRLRELSDVRIISG